MKKIPILRLALALALALVALASGGAAANERGRDVTISAPVPGDLLAAGRSVDVRTPIGGDLAVAGRDVVIAEPVGGYVMAAGAEVAIAGAVGNDLWAAGREVVVTAPIGDSARLAGASVLLQPQASVGRNALLAGRHVEVRAPVEGDLQLRAADALIASEVGGTVRAHTAKLTLAPGAVIHGDLITWGPNRPDIAAAAKVLGQARHHAYPSGAAGIGWWWQWLLGFLALLLLGVVAIAPSTGWSTRVAEKLRDRLGASLLAGIVALFAIPLVVMVLAASVIGIPLAIVLLACYWAVLLLSGVFVSLRIGAWLLARFGKPAASRFARLAIGALLLSLIAALPWLGWIAWLLVPIAGLGALLLERRDAWRRAPAAA